MPDCECTEHALRPSGVVWGRVWNAKRRKGVWSTCIPETQAWKEQLGVSDARWFPTPEPEREDLHGVSY